MNLLMFLDNGRKHMDVERRYVALNNSPSPQFIWGPGRWKRENEEKGKSLVVSGPKDIQKIQKLTVSL